MNGMSPGVPGQPPGPPTFAAPAAAPGVPGMPAVAPQVAPMGAAPPMPAPAAAPPQAPQVFDLDMNMIRQQAEEVNAMAQSRKRESDFHSFKKGINFIRVLPPWSAEVAAKGNFAKYAMTHFGVVGKQGCACWESSLPGYGFICPVCHIRATYGRYMGEALKDIGPRGYHYANALVYTSNDNGSTFLYKRLKPFVHRLPVTVWTGFMQMMQTPYIGNITNVDTGWIVAVNMPESFQGKSTYTWQHVMQGPIAGDENTKAQILAGMHNLDQFADFAIPTVEKLQKQYQLAEALLQTCVASTGWQPDQVPGFGALPLVIPDIVYQTHGQTPTMVAGMPGSAPPMATPGVPMLGSPAQPAVLPAAPMPAAVGMPAPPVASPQPAAVVAAPAAVAPAMPAAPAPVGAPTPGMFPGMPMAGPLAGATAAPAGMPPAPAPAPMMPAAPAPAPMMPAAPAPAPMMPAAPAPAPAPVAMPAVPVPMMPAAPVPGAVMPSAPMPVAPGASTPSPFPPAPAPQQEAVSPTDGAGEKKAKANGKVKCPGCGKDYSGSRGLKVHMNKSESCKKAAAAAPVDVPAAPTPPAAPTAEKAAAIAAAAPAPSAAPAPAPAPAGMAPPGGQPGPFPST